MEQSLKLSNNKLMLILSISFVISIFTVSCDTNKKLTKHNQERILIFGDSILKTGTIIYNNRNIWARFLELNIDDIKNLTKKQITQLYDSAPYIILLRDGLKYSKNSPQLSLTICKGKDIIIKKNEMVFNKYAIISVENIVLYKIKNEYNDSKVRLVFCKNDWNNGNGTD